MKKRASTVIILTLLGSLMFINASMAKEKAEDVALGVSDKWLSFADRGDYSKSWERTAEIFRAMVTKAEWETKLNTFRKPLGKVSERKVKSKQFTTTLTNAPQGEYVVLEYETVFAHQKTLTETVTCIREKDGKWKVAGYYINFPVQESQPPTEKKKE